MTEIEVMRELVAKIEVGTTLVTDKKGHWAKPARVLSLNASPPEDPFGHAHVDGHGYVHLSHLMLFDELDAAAVEPAPPVDLGLVTMRMKSGGVIECILNNLQLDVIRQSMMQQCGGWLQAASSNDPKFLYLIDSSQVAAVHFRAVQPSSAEPA